MFVLTCKIPIEKFPYPDVDPDKTKKGTRLWRDDQLNFDSEVFRPGTIGLHRGWIEWVRFEGASKEDNGEEEVEDPLYSIQNEGTLHYRHNRGREVSVNMYRVFKAEELIKIGLKFKQVLLLQEDNVEVRTLYFK